MVRLPAWLSGLELAEEAADVGGQQIGDLQSGEVPAPLEFGPTRDVVVLFGQGPSTFPRGDSLASRAAEPAVAVSQ